MADFQTSVAQVLKKEGGYVFKASDPGGETKYGITKRSYPALDIKNITPQDAEDIYLRDFWNPMRLAEVNSQAIADQILDTAVNMGTSQAAKIAQAAALNLGQSLKVDGAFGPASLAAVNAVDSSKLASEMVGLRISAYKTIAANRPASQQFLAGWIRRAEAFGKPAAAGIAAIVLGALGLYFILKNRGQA
jgi:lysozyme family protein